MKAIVVTGASTGIGWGQPALDADEINDMITFLCTLTDGYDPKNPTALVLPAQCQSATAAAGSP